MTNLRALYPAIEPYETGHLEVGDGHCIHYERAGTRGAKPAVFLHGGPGGGISPEHRRLFDPARYDVMLFDQRGCGRSTPCGTGGEHHLAPGRGHRAPARTGRRGQMAGVWRLLSSTLALAYAETHPQRVSELILRGVYTVTRAELDWYYQFGVSEMYPDRWKASSPRFRRTSAAT